MKFKAENGHTLIAKDDVQASAFINAGMVPDDSAAKNFKNRGKAKQEQEQGQEQEQ